MSKLVLIAENRPQDCWDWITPEEVSRMALVAFDLARKACKPPAGERFSAGGSPWSGRQDFADNLAFVFELQVKAEAFQMGIGGQDYATEAARLGLWRAKGRDPVALGSQAPSTASRPFAGAA